MKSGKILDLGCGEGRFLSYADLGVDFSKGMMERAKKKGKSLIRASVLSLPFRSGSFDLAFTVDVFFFVEPKKRKSFLDEAKRVSKELYLIETPRTAFHQIFSIFNDKLKQRILIPLSITVTFFLAFVADRVRRRYIPVHVFPESE